MANFSLIDDRESGYTLLADSFIDRFLPEANGEFVKIYIYLLRNLSRAGDSLSLSSVADVFSCTENDVLRALRYWEKQGLMSLVFGQSGELSGIVLTNPKETRPPQESSALPRSRESSEKDIPNGTAVQTGLSSDRSRLLMEQNAEAREIIAIAETYIGRPLSPTDINHILYFYDELHFPTDLIDYLIEYCISRGKRSIHYIEKVGLAWYNDGIRTLDAAKKRTTLWNRDYYAILGAFGISGRNPVRDEVTYMKKWLNEYGFSVDIIKEACSRTTAKTGRPSFHYADSILSSWLKNKVCTVEDIARLDQKYREKKDSRRDRQTDSGAKRAPNRFNNFHQREYDYSQLEKQLLESQKQKH